MDESFPSTKQDGLEQSWREIEQLIKGISGPPANVDISRVEHKDALSTKAVSEEIHKFYLELFDGEETTDPMQIEIGIANGIVDTYVARDEEGKIISLLQSQKLEVVPQKSGKPELMLLVWYVGTNKEYKGKPVTRNLFYSALTDLVEKSKKESKPITALVGETEDEVEGLFNRYGLNRIYYKDKKGNASEVPFESPPEDESKKGVPEHLMVRLLNGSTKMSSDQLFGMVDGIYGQYTRPEYFSAEYLEFAEEFYGEKAGVPINAITAGLYHANYMKVVANIRKKLEKSLRASEGSLFLKSRREREAEGV